jgi:cell wall-associated NlpC family hydrolase
MKISKEKKIAVASVSVLAATVVSVSAISAYNKTSAIAANEVEADTTVTAGVSNVFCADDVVIPSFTSGVSTVLNDFPSATVADSEVDLVALGLDSDMKAAAGETEQAEETAEADEESDDGTFCGYSNLGIANVDTSNLNVREEPSTDSKIVGKMTSHNACEIIDTDGDWYQIKSGNVSGYVKSEYLYTGEEAIEIAKEEVTTYATVTTETLRVRSEESTDSDIVSLVNIGEDLVVVDESDEWALVEVDDESGYVYKEYVTIAQKLPTAKTVTELKYGEGVSDVRVELVQYALQFVGNRYVWGGESLTKGVDCSGFTMKIYEKFGIYLPHSSRAQPSYGTKIKASEAKPGDLFFYGSGKSISHVGIYIGDGQIVHASNKRDGIKISNCYYRTPICVVSYLDD